MRYRYIIKLVAFFATCAWFVSAPLQASLDEIVVTANRRPTANVVSGRADSSVAVDATAGVAVTTDLFDGQAGVFLQQTTPGQGAPIIRGLRGSAVLHLLDGTRVNNTIFRDAPTQYLALIDPNALKSLEIVRGAAASLYGSDAMGGVVNLVTRRPQYSDKPQWSRAVSAWVQSSEFSYMLSADVGHSSQAMASLLTASVTSLGDRRTARGVLADTNYRASALRFAHTAKLSERDNLFTDVQWVRQPSTPRSDELIAGFGQIDPASSEFYFEPNERAFAHIEYTRADGLFASDWEIDLAIQKIDDDRRTRDFNSRIRTLEQNSSTLVSLELSALKDFESINWLYGVEIIRDRVSSGRQEMDIDTGSVNVVPARFSDGSSANSISLFAHSTSALSDRSQLTAGMRVLRYELDTNDLQPNSKIELTEPAGDIGLTFELTDNARIFANVGFGVRMPNIFDVGALGARPGNRFNTVNTNLVPERVRHIDLGVTHWFGAIHTELVLFDINYDDRISSVATGEVTASGRDIVRSENVADAHLYGVEAVIESNLSDRLTLLATVNYQRGTQAVAGESAQPADRIPPLNGRIELRASDDHIWSGFLRVDFASGQNRLSARDIRDPRIDPLGTPGWGAVSLQLQNKRNSNWQWNIHLNNILDAGYRKHGSGLDAPGRNIRFGLKVAW